MMEGLVMILIISLSILLQKCYNLSNSFKKDSKDLELILSKILSQSPQIALVTSTGTPVTRFAFNGKTENSIFSRIPADLIPSLLNQFSSKKIDFLPAHPIKLESSAYSLSISKVFLSSSPAYLLILTEEPASESRNQGQEENKSYDIVRTVSHELRTPVHSIMNLLSMTLSYQLPITCLEKLKIAYASSQYLLCIINDLLDYSQLRAGVLRIRESSFNLRAFATELIELVKIQAALKSLTITLKLGESLPSTIFSDPFRLKQILLNLLSNALKFTQSGSIDLIITRSEKRLKFLCRDTGIGVSADQVLYLCQQFFTDDESKFFNPQGSGLGLSISNMLLKHLGSDGLHIESTLGKGSDFSFFLNIENLEEISNNEDIPEEVCNIHLPYSPNPSLLKGCLCVNPRRTQKSKTEVKIEFKVLIAEDNPFSSAVFHQILAKEEIFSHSVFNGEEAVNEILSHDGKYDLILLDCEMPVLDGWQAAEKLRSLKRNGQIKHLPVIIAVTAHCDAEIKDRCLRAGMDDILIKPCSKRDMVEKVRDWLVFYRLHPDL